MLKILFTIALRNVFKNRKRSLLIGLAIFISSAILLATGALANGAGRQLAARYRAVLSGDVTVVWKNVKEIDPSDAGRLYFSEFDPAAMDANRRAAARFRDFCAARAKEIEAVHTPLRIFGMLDNGRFASFCTIYGLTGDELDLLERAHVFALAAGESMTTYDDYAAVVSEELAAQNHAGIGSWITLDAQTPQGYVNSIEFMVVGLYKNAAPWDNKMVYISDKNARELFQWDESLFAQARVFLKEPERAVAFAREFDSYLLAQSDVLRAEPAGQSGGFFLTFGKTIKSVFLAFTVFLLFVIGLGIRSTVRLSVFERLGEFGTLRAVGFARPSAFVIVFFEVLILGLSALAAAALCALALTTVLGATGLFVGNGVLNSLLGGEYVYPAADPADFLVALGLIGAFSLFSPLKPALRVTFQKITDLLARNQRQVFATVEIIRTAVHANLRRRKAGATAHKRSST